MIFKDYTLRVKQEVQYDRYLQQQFYFCFKDRLSFHKKLRINSHFHIQYLKLQLLLLIFLLAILDNKHAYVVQRLLQNNLFTKDHLCKDCIDRIILYLLHSSRPILIMTILLCFLLNDLVIIPLNQINFLLYFFLRFDC